MVNSDLTSLAGPGVSGTEIETRNSRSYGQFSARCSGISDLLGRDFLRLEGLRYGGKVVAADGLEDPLRIPIPHQTGSNIPWSFQRCPQGSMR